MNWWAQPAYTLWWGSLLATFVLSALLTWLSIRYAHSRNLLDLPGQRRSHSTPTPRGGGIGIVVAVILGLIVFAWWVPSATPPGRLVFAVGLVAAAGWVDDHRPLPAWSRLLAHCIAVLVWLAPMIFAALFAPADSAQQLGSTPQIVGVLLALGLVCVASINLHNFMDGIDGLLALQAIFVLAVLAVFNVRDPASTHTLQMALWAAAIAGFLPFNFPRARVFMGDVGSGVIGLLIAVAVIWQTAQPAVAATSGIIAVSAFATDATCTLASRMLRGRRWYTAHREHLYQWMTRTGMSHARVVVWYMGWNLLIVLPVLWWINRLPPAVMSMKPGYAWAAGVYALAVIIWIFGKRWCVHRVKTDS